MLTKSPKCEHLSSGHAVGERGAENRTGSRDDLECKIVLQLLRYGADSKLAVNDRIEVCQSVTGELPGYTHSDDLVHPPSAVVSGEQWTV